MKRIIIMMLLVLATISANAQIYICTGDNVLVREGPGTNYPINGGFNNYYQTKIRYGRLCKGDIVSYHGQRKNGYMFVYNMGGGNGSYNCGWVSVKYFRQACRKCQNTDWFSNLSQYVSACRTCGRRSFSDY